MKSKLEMAEFFAPLPLAAVVLMRVNDVWLKPTFHNAFTGKLSDLTVCFFLPLYVSALLGLVTRVPLRARLIAGCLIAAAVYTVLELSLEADAWFCSTSARVALMLGIRAHFYLTRDLTDLAALVMIPLAYVWGMKRVRRSPVTGQISDLRVTTAVSS